MAINHFVLHPAKGISEETVTFNPFSDLRVKYVPASLLQTVNDRFLLREPEQLYELQFSSFAIPPTLFSFECYHHLEDMRESYAFVIYFVITDALFYLIPVIVCTFSLVRFVQELQKSLDFQQRATNSGGGGKMKKKKKGLWNLSRSVFALDSLAFLVSLLAIICFTIYWLVVDPDAVFLFETAHYLNTFSIMVISFYFLIKKFGILAKVVNSMYLNLSQKKAQCQ